MNDLDVISKFLHGKTLTEEDVFQLLVTSRQFPIQLFLSSKYVKDPILQTFYKADSILFNPNLTQKAFDRYIGYHTDTYGIQGLFELLKVRRIKVPGFKVLQWASKYPNLNLKDFNMSQDPFSTAKHRHKDIKAFCRIVEHTPDRLTHSHLCDFYDTLMSTIGIRQSFAGKSP
jgi:hypothetical protein